MGKCGGRELNYASDVDVIFVAEPVKDEDETAALGTASRLAAGLIGVCARSTPEGSIFPVDPNLRPEGRAGPLVRTLTSHLAYYERWAKTWEFQALLKARPVAGDMTLGQAYAEHARPAGLAGGPPRAFRRGRAGHAAPGGAVAARQAGRARAQARSRRAARHRVRRPVAAARARPHRRDAALARDAARAGRAGRRRLRRPGRRGGTRRGLPVPAPHRAPAAARPAAAARTPCPRIPPYFAGWAGRCGSTTGRTNRGSRPRSPGSAPTRRSISTRSGAATPARSGGCTRSCSTGRCSTRWPGCPPTPPG